MPATPIDLPVEQGATFRARVVWRTSPSNGQPGDPIDNTGYQARMQVRRTQQSAVLVALNSTPGGGLTLGGADGVIEIFMSDEQTDLLTSATCLYDLEVEAPNGDVYRVCKGKVLVDPNITQESDDPIVGK